jgi:serine/threonine-protein kinase HipA
MVEAGEPLPQQLGDALQDGSAIGGARPKALLRATDDRQYMERFDRPMGGGRRMVVSALTMLGLGEMTSRYG